MNMPVESTNPTSVNANYADRLERRENQHDADDRFQTAKADFGARLPAMPEMWRRPSTRRPSRGICRPSEYWMSPSTMPTPARGESEMPVDGFAEVAADQRAEEPADVDAHVVDREAGIAPRAAFRIQIADNGADVRLQQAGADDDQRQPDIERDDRRDGEREVTGRDDDPAPEHRHGAGRAADRQSSRPAARPRKPLRCTTRKSRSRSRRPAPCRRSRPRWS